MGRKKKGVLETETNEKGETSDRKPALKGDAKKSIAAVFFVALSILLTLGFFGVAGKLGDGLDFGIGFLFGWGKWFAPILFLLLGIFLFRHREITLSDAVKIGGFVVLFFSVLGFFHLYLGDDTQELWKAVEKGRGGGVIGFGLSALFLSFTGTVAGTVILLSFFLIGLIAAFNVSLYHLWGSAREKFSGKSGETDNTPVVSEEIGEPAKEMPTGIEQDLSLSKDFVSEEPVQQGVLAGESSQNPLLENNIRGFEIAGEEEQPQQESDEDPDGNIAEISFSDDDPVRDDEANRKHRKKKSRSSVWEPPKLEYFESEKGTGQAGDVEQMKQTIKNTLKYFQIDVEPSEAFVGPTVTQYTFKPAVGVKLSKITTLNNDIALAVARHPIRIEAPIPGKSLVGIEVPNTGPAFVRMRDAILSPEFSERKSPLTVIVGKDVSGKYIIANLGKMPHLLVAGATNSGKSVCINTILLSLLYQNSPSDLKLILVDPKRVELSFYRGIPHLKADVITDNGRVVGALKWAADEMDRRYEILEQAKVRDIDGYRDKESRGEPLMVPNEERGGFDAEEMPHLPNIVIVIDEMADLMVSHGKEVERLIVRIAQKSRAVGIHLILATQRPDVNVITGLIKANIPARIAFAVQSQIDSRTILDAGGADKLLGNGDMLFLMPGVQQIRRLQGVYVTDTEVSRVVEYLKKWHRENGEDDIEDTFGSSGGGDIFSSGGGEGSLLENIDPMYEQAKALVIETRRASTTFLQTRLGVGYSRGARLMELLEQNGIVGPGYGAKPRDILVDKDGNRTAPQYGDDPIADHIERENRQL